MLVFVTVDEKPEGSESALLAQSAVVVFRQTTMSEKGMEGCLS